MAPSRDMMIRTGPCRRAVRVKFNADVLRRHVARGFQPSSRGAGHVLAVHGVDPLCLLQGILCRNLAFAMERQAEQPDPLNTSQDAANSEPAGEPPKPAKRWSGPRNVTGTREGGDSQILADGAPLGQPTARAEGTSEPPKKWPGFRDATGTDEGRGLQIFGWDVAGRKPPAMPDESELRQVAESPHRYPDLPQAPTRDQFADDATFNTAMSHWLVNVAPVVWRRNKYGKPRPKSGSGLQSTSVGRASLVSEPQGKTENDAADASPSKDELPLAGRSSSGEGIVVSPHPYSDLPQAPTKEKYPDPAALKEAMASWQHRVAPIVAMRNKSVKPPHQDDKPPASTDKSE